MPCELGEPGEWISEEVREHHRLARDVLNTGGCANPVQLRTIRVDKETGEQKVRDLRIACKDRRAALCPACSARYKADAWFLATSGTLGGKGLPSDVATHPKVFATLTAPSFGAVHTIRDDGRCHPRRTPPCEHAMPTACHRRHAADDDEALGSPLCEWCFDYDAAVLWNAMASRLWHRTVDRLRRRLGASQGLSQAAFRAQAQVHQLRVAETQRRGLVHIHAIVRADGPEGHGSDPPAWLTSELLALELRAAATTTSILAPDRTKVRWGDQLDVAEIPSVEDAGRAAGYIAKYATKTVDGSFGLVQAFRTRDAILRATTTSHLRRFALAVWDLGQRDELEDLRLREHAHTLGFAGHLITKSRGYSTTFAALRGARALFAIRDIPDDVEFPLYAFGYLGRGYGHPEGERMAEFWSAFVAEDRKERRQQRLADQEAQASSEGSLETERKKPDNQEREVHLPSPRAL